MLIQLPAVLWTLFTYNRKVSIKLPRSAVLYGFITPRRKSVHKTAQVQQFCPSQNLCPQNCLGPAVLQAPHIEMVTDDRKVSIELPRSAVLSVLVDPVGKVSIKLPRSGSSVRMKCRQQNCLGPAVLSTQKCVHRTAKVRSFMDTLKYCHIWQESPSVQFKKYLKTSLIICNLYKS